MPAVAKEQGYVDVGPGRVWYESAGEGPRTLLLLHGGPGADSSTLAQFLDLAELGFRVVRYNQLGSYLSDLPDDPSLWRVPRFVDEVETVRQALDLGKMHLFGQSWGSFLALEYALHHGDNLKSLTLASGAASTRQCVDGMNRWRRDLPVETRELMSRCEAAEDYSNPEYADAVETLYRRHLCRLWPYPDVLAQAMTRMSAPVYTSMWGPNEFTCTGTLMDWERRDRLGEIAVPTLITCGEFDEVHPDCARTMHEGILGSELVIFAGCSHLADLEQPELYRETFLRFLDRVEQAA